MSNEQRAQVRSQGSQSGTRGERRRHRRVDICIPITVTCSNGIIVEGYTENLSIGGLLAQSVGGMPVLGEDCFLTLYLEAGTVVAHGRVLRVNRERRTFAIMMHYIGGNGPALLARQLEHELERGS